MSLSLYEQTLVSYEGEPASRWDVEDITALLLWSVEQGMSDLFLSSGEPIRISRMGFKMPVTKRIVTTAEINDLMDGLSKSGGTSADLQGGNEKNFAYSLKKDRRVTYRFRVNATSTQIPGQMGSSMTMRFIPPYPPLLETMNIEQEILDNFEPSDGFVLVTGNTGTGKTTLIGAMIRDIISRPGKSCLTYEQPVEFMFKEDPERQSLIDHHEIGTNLLTWANAPSNANRRDPDVVFLGEAKEYETFAGLLELGNIGKACYASLHTSRPRMVIPRILDKFPFNERAQAFSILVSNLRVIIAQKLLVHKSGKKRVAIREYVVFTAADKEALLLIQPVEVPVFIDNLVRSRGTSFVNAAKVLFQADEITEETFQNIEKEYGFSTSKVLSRASIIESDIVHKKEAA